MYSYQLNKGLYLNITNRCSNRCTFCVRNTADGVGEQSLWLDQEPTVQEVLASIDDPNKYEEIVFCGFGEPLTRVDVVVGVARELKKQCNTPIRINTNGQANLIHQRNIVPELAGLIDVMSISLNAENAQKYNAICQSDFGEEAYEAVLNFAKLCKGVIPQVILSVVDRPDVDVVACRKLADQIGVPLRVRTWSPDL